LVQIQGIMNTARPLERIVFEFSRALIVNSLGRAS
jgi:hypothetical protein